MIKVQLQYGYATWNFLFLTWPPPFKGPAGNVEFLAHLVLEKPGDCRVDIEAMVDHCLEEQG